MSFVHLLLVLAMGLVVITTAFAIITGISYGITSVAEIIDKKFGKGTFIEWVNLAGLILLLLCFCGFVGQCALEASR